MRNTLMLLVAVCLIACGGGDKGPAVPPDAGSPIGEGIVQSVKGTVAVQGTHAEGQGSVELEVSHTDRLINQKVRVFISDAAGAEVAKGEGNQPFPLTAGTYSARIIYTETELAGGFEGAIRGLVVHPGAMSEYAVGVSAPVGILRMRFSDGKDSVSDKVSITVFHNDDDPDLVVGPAFRGAAGENVVLPVGKYQVKAVFTPDKGLPITEWYKDIQVDGAMARTEREIVLELDVTGLQVDAFNYGRDINARTRVYMYAPGADVAFAVARFQGKAGDAIPAEPGSYDVRVVYTPSQSTLDFIGDKTVPNVRVHRGLGTRLQVDVERPLATLRLQIMEGEVNINDKAELRVMRAGADVDAASPIVDEIGVGQHPVPVETYDIYIKAQGTAAAPVQHKFMGVELANGYVWEQTFDIKNDSWEAAPVRKPATELRAVDWKAPSGDDDDSAGDDDDSSGDDDDSSKK